MHPNLRAVIRDIAKQEGISEHKVLVEMKRAIHAGWCSADPTVRAQWAAMPFDGEPEPEKLIAYLADEARRMG